MDLEALIDNKKRWWQIKFSVTINKGKYMKASQDEYIALKLLEALTKSEKLETNVFIEILNDFRGKIDFKDFSCYHDSSGRNLIHA